MVGGNKGCTRENMREEVMAISIPEKSRKSSKTPYQEVI
jgi:hypothetical protein